MGSFKFDDSGLKKFMKNLEKAADEISGEKSLDELFTPSFMSQYTDFNSFDELLSAGNFVVNSQEDFKNIPEDEFDIHISSTTKFNSWEDMKAKAGQIYFNKALSKL